MSKKPNAEKLQNKKLLKEEQKKKTYKKVAIITTAVILAVALVTSAGIFTFKLVDGIIKDSGDKYRETVVFESEHYKVDAAMMSYFFYDMLYDGVLDSHGVDDPNDLKDITYDTEGKENFYDYYSQYAANLMKSYILYAEAAIADGVTLGEKENTRIDNQMASFGAAAAALGTGEKEYIFAHYGRGINKNDIRTVLELSALAKKQLSVVYNSQVATGEEIAEEIDEMDALKYFKVDYYMIDFTVSVPQNEGAYKTEHERLKKLTEELAACHTEEEFLKKAKELYTKEYTDEDGKLTIDMTVDELIESCFFKGEAVTRLTEESNAIDVWAHDFDRKAGDTTTIDGSRSLAALFMVKPAYSVDTPTTAVRYIAIDGDNYVKTSDALAQLNALKKQAEVEKTEAKFIELAEKYSEDALNAAKGGLCEDTYAEDSFCKSIAGWLSESKEGDITQVTVANCYYLVYNCGEGRTRSEIDAEMTVISKKYSKVLEGYAKDIKVENPDKTDIGLYAPLK